MSQVTDMGQVTVHTDLSEEDWLALRAQGIGASEASMATGFEPSRLKLHLTKRGVMPPVEVNEAMLWGTLHEPLLAQQYQKHTGKKILFTQPFVRSVEEPWRFATMDAICEDGTMVEFKCINAFTGGREVGEQDEDIVPARWPLQAAQQMDLGQHIRGVDASKVEFAVLVGGNSFRVLPVQRSDDLCDMVRESVNDIWLNYISRGIAPVATIPDMKIWHHIYGSVPMAMEVGADGAQLAAEHEALRAQKSEAEKAVKLIEEQVKASKLSLLKLLGQATEGNLPDGRVIKRSQVDVTGGWFEREGYSYQLVNISTPKQKKKKGRA